MLNVIFYQLKRKCVCAWAEGNTDPLGSGQYTPTSATTIASMKKEKHKKLTTFIIRTTVSCLLYGTTTDLFLTGYRCLWHIFAIQ